MYKLTNYRGRNGLTTSFQVFTMWYWISCSFLVIITHLCCALVCYYHQKAHLIPYHMVNTWNSVVNPSLYIKCPYIITWLTAHFVCGLMSDLVICKFRKDGHTWHRMSLLRPGVIKQHWVIWSASCCWTMHDLIAHVSIISIEHHAFNIHCYEFLFWCASLKTLILIKPYHKKLEWLMKQWRASLNTTKSINVYYKYHDSPFDECTYCKLKTMMGILKLIMCNFNVINVCVTQ